MARTHTNKKNTEIEKIIRLKKSQPLQFPKQFRNEILISSSQLPNFNLQIWTFTRVFWRKYTRNRDSGERILIKNAPQGDLQAIYDHAD